MKKHPEIFQQLIDEGHALGNHTFHHVDGWNTTTRSYLREVQQCAEVFSSKLFRPPYGRMRPAQRKAIQRKYKIVLWDVLTYDFDKDWSGEDCLQTALKYSREGSIVVFHDSEKAKESQNSNGHRHPDSSGRFQKRLRRAQNLRNRSPIGENLRPGCENSMTNSRFSCSTGYY